MSKTGKTRRKKRIRKPASRGTRPRQTTEGPERGGGERLQKVLARAGLGSRRALEARIAAGEIRINSHTARLGDSAAEDDRVELDRKQYRVVRERGGGRTLIYHKPVGEITTRDDPGGRPTVFDKLPKLRGSRWVAIGRLDLNTSGLLLLTTDGELAHRMMHPSGSVDREYVCRIRGPVSDGQIEKLKNGIILEDGMACFSDIVPGAVTAGHCWYTITIMEGRNREVRRLWEAVGATVSQLKRVRFGPVFLPPGLRPGKYQELTAEDHRILRQDVGLTRGTSHLALKRI